VPGTRRKIPASEAPPALETANRACRLKIYSASERPAYGTKVPAAGKKALAGPAFFYDSDQLLCDVEATLVGPTIFKPADQFAAGIFI
jgi:hypothetical protein